MRKVSLETLHNSYLNRVQTLMDNNNSYQDLAFMVKAKGENYVSEKLREESKVYDEKWISELEKGFMAIDRIIQNPRKFIKEESEVVLSALAKKITSQSITHLASHTQFIRSVDEKGNVTPEKILSFTTEEDLQIYENRFVMTLMQKLVVFIEKRYSFIKDHGETRDSDVLLVHSKTVINGVTYEVDSRLKVSTPSNDNGQGEHNNELLEKIKRLRERAGFYLKCPFMQGMAGAKPVHNPIAMTNMLLKSPDYHKAYELWKFIDAYTKLGVTYSLSETEQKFSDEYLNELYGKVLSDMLLINANRIKKGEVAHLVTKKKTLTPKVRVNLDDETFLESKFAYDEFLKKPKPEPKKETPLAMTPDEAKEAKRKALLKEKEDIKTAKAAAEKARILKEKEAAKEAARLLAEKKKAEALLAKQKALEEAARKKEEERLAKIAAAEEKKRREEAALLEEELLRKTRLEVEGLGKKDQIQPTIEMPSVKDFASFAGTLNTILDSKEEKEEEERLEAERLAREKAEQEAREKAAAEALRKEQEEAAAKALEDQKALEGAERLAKEKEQEEAERLALEALAEGEARKALAEEEATRLAKEQEEAEAKLLAQQEADKKAREAALEEEARLIAKRQALEEAEALARKREQEEAERKAAEKREEEAKEKAAAEEEERARLAFEAAEAARLLEEKKAKEEADEKAQEEAKKALEERQRLERIMSNEDLLDARVKADIARAKLAKDKNVVLVSKNEEKAAPAAVSGKDGKEEKVSEPLIFVKKQEKIPDKTKEPSPIILVKNKSEENEGENLRETSEPLISVKKKDEEPKKEEKIIVSKAGESVSKPESEPLIFVKNREAKEEKPAAPALFSGKKSAPAPEESLLSVKKEEEKPSPKLFVGKKAVSEPEPLLFIKEEEKKVAPKLVIGKQTHDKVAPSAHLFVSKKEEEIKPEPKMAIGKAPKAPEPEEKEFAIQKPKKPQGRHSYKKDKPLNLTMKKKGGRFVPMYKKDQKPFDDDGGEE